MRHRIKKIKFRQGVDANQGLVRKLTISFLKKGRIETTVARAKMLKSVLDSMLSKTQNQTKATTRILYKALGKKELVNKVLWLGETLEKRDGGFVRLIRLNNRVGDGAPMARVELLTIPENMIAKKKAKKTDQKSKSKEELSSEEKVKTKK